MNSGLSLPARVSINDVVVRDGFQSEPNFIATESKIALIDRLSATGLSKIEITSFVSPKAVPNLRDATEVCRGVIRRPNVTFVALVPNLLGCERAMVCEINEINLVMSISESHNLANMRMSTMQSLKQFADIMALTRSTSTQINGTLATAFGCPFEGVQDQMRVLATVQAYLDLGMTSITLADTTGMANPQQVRRMADSFLARFPQVPLTMHFHNTRGMGLANVLAAATSGVRSFDASLGGLGGCPYAPGATGNICTEDTVHMLHACGVATGIDLDLLLGVARDLSSIVGHEVPGQLVRSGKSTDLHPCPASVIALQDAQVAI
ncbi:MAG: hydroxymethylglutaryl-CoA lyase [Rhodoferax sp.]|jgi:hydroxymethylglutaryl-CoA lyase|uniref:hydroxymethylglutaryl-CoA lyase n=1 Tax=Rhodoferax sp. TaxID=50421 RepID=UPI001B4ABA61|nr:hydroxymethylglutaryl-CoA lyase [Rhodoferax sp.]MBP8286089.1 hydroxymethylglutaryl-CoA lyase [Rhodoferax sp.]MBP9149829.1 hydroxymethylglutaryl-CoA lyase [Rhodoferax sp.]MBP9737010.1 hydroxymethylglutaryl-CoA lyase [Rhodoferax sp.]